MNKGHELKSEGTLTLSVRRLGAEPEIAVCVLMFDPQGDASSKPSGDDLEFD